MEGLTYASPPTPLPPQLLGYPFERLMISRLPSKLGFEKVPLFASRGFMREPNPPRKGIRVLLGILDIGFRRSGAQDSRH